MKAMRIHSFGGPEVMRLEDVKVPLAEEDELLVRVYAASVNPVDYKTRQGKFPLVGEGNLPFTLGRDLSGTVVQCDPSAQIFQQGDSVYAMLDHDRGAFAEYVVVKHGEAAMKPDRLGHIDAAAVPLAALTAWQGLFDHGKLRGGQKVLIHGGGGGVGHFAIQFAKEKGATVVTTVSRDDIDFVRGLGADQVIDYRNQDFTELAKDVDLVFDLVAGVTQERSWSVLKPGGILVSTLGEPPEAKAKEHDARSVGFMAQPNSMQLMEIALLIDAGRVRPRVDRTFPFTAVADAEGYQEGSHVRGKVVVEFPV